MAAELGTTTNIYNALGLLASVDGPRTDVADITSFDYDAQGNRIKTTGTPYKEGLNTRSIWVPVS